MASLLSLIEDIPNARPPGANPEITGVAYDSRKVEPGSLFVAIRGTHADGHAFVAQALERGAAALLVDARFWQPAQIPGGVPLVVAENSLAALAPVAAAFYGHPGRALAVVGITGSKGKTSTASLTRTALEASGAGVGLMGTLEFQIGARRWANTTRQSTLEALEVQAMLREMADAGCRFAVLEATSHALSAQWNRLGGCDFDVAALTNVTHEHLDYHGSVEQYRRDKARLFELLGEEATGERGRAKAAIAPASPVAFLSSPTKWAIVNADDPHHTMFLHAAPTSAQRLTYGVEQPADVRASAVVATPEGSTFQLETPWGAGAVRLHLPGMFNVHNALAALSIALCQGVPLDKAAAALASVGGVRGRMERVDAGQPFGVIVDYAHNPDSFEQVLGMLRPLTRGRLIALFGSAGERDRAKRSMQGAIAARFCDLLVLTDEDPRGEDREAIIAEIAEGARRAMPHVPCVAIPDRRDALRHALAEAREGDLVLLLGKGHESTIQYANGSVPWDEAGVAREVLAELGYGSTSTDRAD
jgi:UDP-N-acetylmuramoyl-L-alanyl-D-glutamate--2,6-diaminopimelate ligase